jgi:aspartyl-tRNA synthetase
MIFRTHKCNELNIQNKDEEVILSAWVYRVRNLGSLLFVDLRDRYGITQLVFDPSDEKSNFKEVPNLKSEFVIRIEGIVRPRPSENINKDLSTGEIEVLVKSFQILSESKTLPFEIDQDKPISEELRLKYRYLDLRKDKMRKNIILRTEICNYFRELFIKQDFLEIETPILIKGTPEGSREYIVPSRLYPGNFYVLPQSPQQLKQILMVSGFDRYFQFARCFRDEDQRGDRQPEFTQLDIEMSFVDTDDVLNLLSDIVLKVFKKFSTKPLSSETFPIMTFDEAMNRYGSDKPDIRFEMELIDFKEFALKSDFNVFKDILNNGGVCKAVLAEKTFTRKEHDEIEEYAKRHGAKGLSYISFAENEIKGNAIKFFSEDLLTEIKSKLKIVNGSTLFIGAGEFENCCNFMGQVRLVLGKMLDLIDENIFAFLWVKDFPMFETDSETGALASKHHPFTSPKDFENFDKNPSNAIAKAYDLVLNGNELGGGSIRIHDAKLQKKVFELLNITETEIERRFGHMIEAFSYGVPPHGGIAFGIDRIVMLLAGEPNIREVIAFPKDQKARDLMIGAPTPLPEESLKEANISVLVDKSENL